MQQFLTEYGAVLNLSGYLLAVVGLVLALYIWFNPRQLQGKIRYKFHYEYSFFRRITRSYRQKFYLDVWNPSRAGLDESGIRESLKLTFPRNVVGAVSVVETVGVDIAAVAVSQPDGDGSAEIRWKYLDPGMGFRLLLELKADAPDDIDLTVSGGHAAAISGRFKDFKIETPVDLEELPERVTQVSSLLTVAVLAFMGFLAAIVVSRSLPKVVIDAFGVDVVLALVLTVIAAAIYVASVFSTIGLGNAIKFVLNTKSPLPEPKWS